VKFCGLLLHFCHRCHVFVICAIVGAVLLDISPPLDSSHSTQGWLSCRSIYGIQEYWRKVVVDFTRTDPTEVGKLAAWLNTNQPISLAVNGPRSESLDLGISLFEKTGMVVNTIGSTDTVDTPPAMTCQARPQEAEIFGEFPPRGQLEKYTRFPVFVPSSTPAYDTAYPGSFSLSCNRIIGG
jgi:hypothetical protein